MSLIAETRSWKDGHVKIYGLFSFWCGTPLGLCLTPCKDHNRLRWCNIIPGRKKLAGSCSPEIYIQSLASTRGYFPQLLCQYMKNIIGEVWKEENHRFIYIVCVSPFSNSQGSFQSPFLWKEALIAGSSSLGWSRIIERAKNRHGGKKERLLLVCNIHTDCSSFHPKHPFFSYPLGSSYKAPLLFSPPQSLIDK